MLFDADTVKDEAFLFWAVVCFTITMCWVVAEAAQGIADFVVHSRSDHGHLADRLDVLHSEDQDVPNHQCDLTEVVCSVPSAEISARRRRPFSQDVSRSSVV